MPALLDSEWKALGYIPAKKVPKVSIAISKSELVDTQLKNVVDQFIHDLVEFKYFNLRKIGNGCLITYTMTI